MKLAVSAAEGDEGDEEEGRRSPRVVAQLIVATATKVLRALSLPCAQRFVDANRTNWDSGGESAHAKRSNRWGVSSRSNTTLNRARRGTRRPTTGCLPQSSQSSRSVQ